MVSPICHLIGRMTPSGLKATHHFVMRTTWHLTPWSHGRSFIALTVGCTMATKLLLAFGSALNLCLISGLKTAKRGADDWLVWTEGRTPYNQCHARSCAPKKWVPQNGHPWPSCSWMLPPPWDACVGPSHGTPGAVAPTTIMVYMYTHRTK